jgi:hypothetical protein
LKSNWKSAYFSNCETEKSNLKINAAQFHISSSARVWFGSVWRKLCRRRPRAQGDMKNVIIWLEFAMRLLGIADELSKMCLMNARGAGIACSGNLHATARRVAEGE